MSAPLLQARIARRSAQGEGICAFELVPANGERWPQFTAGAHVDVHVGENLVRQYSLCNNPAEEGRYEIAVLRDPRSRGGSRLVHERLHEGDIVKISPPRNYFALNEQAQHSVLLAGGIGITPLISMMERLAHRNASFELHYCVRSLAHVAFAERLLAARFAGRVHLHADDATDAERLDMVAALRSPDAMTHAYICGPGGFIDWAAQSALDKGWQSGNLHIERFASVTNVITGETNADRPFEMVIASTGRVVHVSAVQSAADALVAAGIDLPLSCEQGVCGTCLTGVLEGDPDHRDSLLNADERGRRDQFLPCCSRSNSPRLVIDL